MGLGFGLNGFGFKDECSLVRVWVGLGLSMNMVWLEYSVGLGLN